MVIIIITINNKLGYSYLTVFLVNQKHCLPIYKQNDSSEPVLLMNHAKRLKIMC